jgi:hypothetical protein
VHDVVLTLISVWSTDLIVLQATVAPQPRFLDLPTSVVRGRISVSFEIINLVFVSILLTRSVAYLNSVLALSEIRFNLVFIRRDNTFDIIRGPHN